MADWQRYCDGVEGMSAENGEILVVFPDERRHRVLVSETPDSFELSSIVARASVVEGVADTPLKAWRRNRVSQLVGFRIDRRGRLVGEAWVPKAGLQQDEFLQYVRRVAAECDLFEYHLTGQDRE